MTRPKSELVARDLDDLHFLADSRNDIIRISADLLRKLLRDHGRALAALSTRDGEDQQ